MGERKKERESMRERESLLEKERMCVYVRVGKMIMVQVDKILPFFYFLKDREFSLV